MGRLWRRPAAHLCHGLLGVEDGVVLQFGPGTQRSVQVFVRPRLGLHEGRVLRPLRFQQRPEGIEPGPVEVLGPRVQLQCRDFPAQLRHLLRVVKVGRFAHRVENGVGFLGTQRRHHVESLRQPALVVEFTYLTPGEFVEDVGVQDETLAHEAEALRHLLLILEDIDPHRVDLRGWELAGGLDEDGEFHLVGDGRDRGIGAEDGVPQRAVLVKAQIVRLADDKDGGIVDSRPDVSARLAIHDDIAQDVGDEECHAGLVGSLQPHVDATVPHHGTEVTLKLLAAGVVAPGDVLGVVLTHTGLVEALRRGIGVAGVAGLRAILAEDRTGAHTLMRLDQCQFTIHQVGHLRRCDGTGVDERFGHGEVSDDTARNVLQFSALQFGVESLGRLQTGSGEHLDIRRKVLPLQVTQHLVEEQVVDVVDGIGGDEDGDFLVAGILVHLEELQPFGRRDDEAILRQERAPRVAERETLVVGQCRHVHRERIAAIGRGQTDGDLGVGGEARSAHVVRWRRRRGWRDGRDSGRWWRGRWWCGRRRRRRRRGQAAGQHGGDEGQQYNYTYS